MRKPVYLSLLLVILFLLTSCGISDMLHQSDVLHRDEKAEVPFDDSEVKGMHYQEVIEALEKSGFTNIKKVRIADVYADWMSGGDEVEYVTIDEKKQYKAGKKFETDIPVEVAFHVVVDSSGAGSAMIAPERFSNLNFDFAFTKNTRTDRNWLIADMEKGIILWFNNKNDHLYVGKITGNIERAITVQFGKYPDYYQKSKDSYGILLELDKDGPSHIRSFGIEDPQMVEREFYSKSEYQLDLDDLKLDFEIEECPYSYLD